jgi:hypothetical protein
MSNELNGPPYESEDSQEQYHSRQPQQPSNFDNSRFRKVNAYGDQDKPSVSNPRSEAAAYGAGGYSSVGGNYGSTGASYGSTDRSSYGSARAGTDRYGGGGHAGYSYGDELPARDSHVPHVVMDDLDEVLMFAKSLS